MLRITSIGLLALVGLMAATLSAPAEVFSLQTPRVAIKVGPAFIPGLSIQAPGTVPVSVASPVIVQDPTLPPPTRIVPGTVLPAEGVILPAPAPAVLRPMTHYEFASCFTPTPGCHTALLIHPGSGCPVLVRFNLPPGCPKVRVAKRDLIFDYGCCKDVAIRFKIFGKVGVNYN